MNDRPAVVLPLLYNVDLLAAARRIAARRPVLRLKHNSCARLPVYPLRVAIAVSPDFRPRAFLIYERIVLRNCAIIIKAQDFAAQRIQPLCNLFLRSLARSDVEFRVRSESQTASGVKLRRRNVFDNHFPIRQCIPRLTKSHDAITLTVTAIVSVAEIELMILSELRVKRQTHQPALASCFDIRDSSQRLSAQLPVLNHAHAPRSLRDEDAPIGYEDD